MASSCRVQEKKRLPKCQALVQLVLSFRWSCSRDSTPISSNPESMWSSSRHLSSPDSGGGSGRLRGMTTGWQSLGCQYLPGCPRSWRLVDWN